MKFYHGEVIGETIEKIPENAKPIEIKKKDFVVVGESETLGNDHRVETKEKDKIKFFKKDDYIYMINVVPARIYCPKDERHSEGVIPPGTWKFKKAIEWDYLEQQKRAIAD